MTASIEGAFGSHLMARGFMLNNELTDFSFAPRAEGLPVANRVEADKRPRSSMSPTLVLGRDGRLVMAIGSPGGRRIIAYPAKATIAALDWQLSMQEIGRASCGERVCQYGWIWVVAVSEKKIIQQTQKK